MRSITIYFASRSSLNSNLNDALAMPSTFHKIQERPIIMKSLLAIATCLGLVFVLLQGCDSRDGTLDPINGSEPDPGNVLVAPHVSTAPTIDGVANDAVWDLAESIIVATSVVDIPSFAGYGGRSHQVELKAAYDDSFVYFQARYNDATLDSDRQTWYVDPATGQWMQESGRPLFDEDGLLVRRAFYEDKFSLMWQATPVADFPEVGCTVACHVGLSPFSNEGGKTALKYTNTSGELLDMWHFKWVRSAGSEIPTMDDQYTDWTSTASNGGRHSDPGTNSYVNNKQTLNGLDVPLYVMKNPVASYYWITPDQILSGEAAQVMSINASGDLTLSDGSVLLASDPDYQRDGQFRPPSIYTRLPADDRADITAVAVYEGGFWTIEISRARVTGNEVDVQFDDLSEDYPFGVAVFDNAQIAHATSTQPFFLRFN